MTATTEPRVRIARRHAVCPAPGCFRLIEPGSPIIKPGPGAWRHLNCERPGRRVRREDGAR